MHSTIKDIVRSTEKRIQYLRPGSHVKVSGDIGTNKRDIVTAIEKKREQGKVAVIAEVKPASPGKKIRDITPDDAATIASEMEKAGAVAISVLTEPEFFHGSLSNLEAVRKNISLPVLRKDFIINEAQFEEIESDLILLIAGILEDRIDRMVDIALSKGYEPLVEVHDKAELAKALKTNSRLIGVNNRDLKTLEIDLDTSLRLIPLIKEFDRKNNTYHTIVSESGMHTTIDVKKVIEAGADAVLVGTSIIESGKIHARTRDLVDALDQ